MRLGVPAIVALVGAVGCLSSQDSTPPYRGALIDPNLWVPLETEDDPFSEHRPGRAFCQEDRFCKAFKKKVI